MMNALTVLFRNEWGKQLARRKVLVFGIIAALAPILLALLQNAILPGRAILSREDLFSTGLNLLATLIFPLMAAVLALDAFTDEIAKGSIRSTLFLPAERSTIYWGKGLSAWAGSAFAIGCMWVSSLLTGLFLPGRDSFLLWFGAGFASFVASLVPMAMIVALVMGLAQWMKSAGGILLSLVLGSMVVNLLPLLVRGVSTILPTTWLRYGAVALSLPLSGWLAALAVLLSWTMVFGMAGWLRFEKRAF